MISDRDKQELAKVFATVLDVRMKALYTEIANGMVCMLNCFAEDLTKIMNQQTAEHVKLMMQAAQGNDRAAERVSELMIEGLKKKG